MNVTEASIALNLIPDLGPVRLGRLLEAFGSADKVLAAKRSDLMRVDGIRDEIAAAIMDWENRVDLAKELQHVSDFGASVITRLSPEYPRALREIHNPPFLLYVWGTIEERDHRAIAVVGSRKTSHYGLDCAKKLSYQLAFAGYTVVSGLARGIDTAAHMAAIAAKGRTIAVIGSGLMDLYPAENKDLAERIAQHGAVVSEYPMTFPPSTQTFPFRNRIVSGWGQGILVIEAGASSGALIAAQHAIEQGRLVYAVPGQIDRPTSAGCHRLIQQGAKLVTGAHDILDDLQSLIPEPRRRLPVQKMLFSESEDTEETGHNRREKPTPKPVPMPVLSEEEMSILEAIQGETLLDAVISRTRLPVPRVSATLFGLELKRLVRALPGQRYVRTG